jgi:hypothetical protein
MKEGHGSKFGRKKEVAIAALISARTLEEAARETGIHVRTLRRWMKIPEFRHSWLAERREVVCHSTARLQNATGAAATTLIKSMIDPSLSASERLKAARHVLELSQRGIEHEDLDIRISQLERAKETLEKTESRK